VAVKIRDFEVRLARNAAERKLVRRLRWDCFIIEEGMPPSSEMAKVKEEWDDFDAEADYMAVFHKDKVVGTYRIIDRDAAAKTGFYTATEFDIAKIVRRKGNIMEMSRACVDQNYRDNPLVLSMLWLGLAEYIQRRKIQLVFGVVSFFGSMNPATYAQAISYIYYNRLAPPSLRATVAYDKMDPNVNPKLTRMNILPKVFVDKDLAFKQMPPLMKGYMRLGGIFGNGICIIPTEGCLDLFVMIQTKNISKEYQRRFTGKENAFDNLALKDTPMQKINKLLMLPFKGVFLPIKAIAELFLTDEYLQEAEMTDEN